ncbi:MAG: acyltransferase [Dechloromonas sp.]|uniref:Acyltransferase n=1 Tax=Candidatus Dechloromonas phosphorivorans TaxID=2899244 RepID=A0A935MTU7_9RHOO|nr:acyltransferase [Candidatus Dechloromonas phosphorivorans]
MGLMAVDVFFITSGFLITGSLLKRGGAIEFIWARALRIFPALVVMLVITVFGMGLFVTTLPVDQYLTSKQVYSYFVYCATLFFGVAYDLPGVFTDNPYKNASTGHCGLCHTK